MIEEKQDEKILIAAFYRFVPLPDFELLKQPMLDFCKAHDMKGTILLAREGINSTISATPENMGAFFKYLDTEPVFKGRFANMARKIHEAKFKPFEKMKVRLKKEIVRLAVDELDMANVGEYVKPDEWDELISDPEVLVIDTRNDYEVQLGRFKGALNPKTDDFRSFPEWVKKNLNPRKHKKIAMYCTGGIRCEKSTALLKQWGFEKVYHLKGGILQYLEDTNNDTQIWEGDCFVFDDRIALDPELKPSKAPLCKTCGQPFIAGDVRFNQKGAECPSCRDMINKPLA